MLMIDPAGQSRHPAGMNFQSLSRCPIAYDPSKGAEVAALIPQAQGQSRELLIAVAGTAPYLAGLMAREAAWLAPALHADPADTLATILAPLPATPPDQLAAHLRQAKRRVALLVALADLGGLWTLEQVTLALSRLADSAIHTALQHLTAEEIRRGKLPGAEPADAENAAGMVVLAMGKLGAEELNYSSDIDLICLYDESRYGGQQEAARASFIRIVRRLTALLSDQTDQGYVFRTDLRLRPDAAVTPVCLSMAAAESYYESVGRTWERAAYIKARPAGGDLAAGARFLRSLVPFVWRKHLDFAAIQDAHDMRLRIRDHRGYHGKLVLEAHDMKLGQGGIREIEFFTQTRQLIAGGRDPDLRARQTLPALAALASKGWVAPKSADDLAQQYRCHREVEHRLQMLADAQTHSLPATAEGFDRLARFMGEASTPRFRQELLERLTATQALTEGFFAPAAPAGTSDLPALSDEATAIIDGWRSYRALRSPRAVELFKRVKPLLVLRLAKSSNPQAAVLEFDQFIKGLPAGVQVFSLFESNPHLIDLLVDIAATAPNLARYLARNSAVLDAVIGGSFFAPWPGCDGLRQELTGVLAAAADYERRLDAARRWAKEWHFRIGVHHLRGLIDPFEAARHYADLAEACVAALWPEVLAELARKHGAAPGRGAVVVGMGSLGAQRLNAGSDLDLIVIYDASEADLSCGPRPLAARSYYAKLTQALVTALSAPMAEGKLYEVDMRLRPSGRQGPVATSFDSFRAYQTSDAWTWEHLAQTRARILAGNPALGGDVEQFRQRLLIEKGKAAKVTSDVADMRARLRAAKAPESLWDVKQTAGGLMDIELLAQTAALMAGDMSRQVESQLAAGVGIRWITAEQEAALRDSYRLIWQVHAASRLLGERMLDPVALGPGGAAFVLGATGQPDIGALAAGLAQSMAAADRIISSLLPGEAAHDA